MERGGTSYNLGNIGYTKIQYKGQIKVVVDDFQFNYTLLHNWFVNAIYPPTTIIPLRPLDVFVVRPDCYISLPSGKQVYTIQSDTHFYPLWDSGKQPVHKYWFPSLSFPINQIIGDLNIIGFGFIQRIP